jgi:hypothetical protein
MRKWLARKLFNLALRLDWDEIVLRSLAFLMIEAEARARIAPKKKRGRPAGRKDSVGSHAWKPIPPKPKRGRPLGSKNKPKVQP